MVMVVGVIAAVDRRFGCSDSCDYIRMAIEMRHGTGGPVKANEHIDKEKRGGK